MFGSLEMDEFDKELLCVDDENIFSAFALNLIMFMRHDAMESRIAVELIKRKLLQPVKQSIGDWNPEGLCIRFTEKGREQTRLMIKALKMSLTTIAETPDPLQIYSETKKLKILMHDRRLLSEIREGNIDRLKQMYDRKQKYSDFA